MSVQTHVCVGRVGPQALQDPQQMLAASFPPPWLPAGTRSHIVCSHDGSWISFCSCTVAYYIQTKLLFGNCLEITAHVFVISEAACEGISY